MNDSISRQDAIDVWDKLSKRGRTEFDQVLMTLPSAEPKTGEWQEEIKGNGWNEWAVLTCDQCGAVIENPTFETNYCPNCGARMIERMIKHE